MNQDISTRLAEIVAEDAILYGLSEKSEITLKDFMKENLHEPPYSVLSVLGLLPKEEVSDPLDCSGDFSFQLSSVEAEISFFMDASLTNKEVSINCIKELVEQVLNGTNWELQQIISIVASSDPKPNFLAKIGVGKLDHRFRVSISANCFDLIEEDSEEEVFSRLDAFKEEQEKALRLKLASDDVLIKILTRDVDIAVIPA